MANGSFRLGKQSGGTLGLVFPDGVSDTEVVLPESGELATKEYVKNNGDVSAVTGFSQISGTNEIVGTDPTNDIHNIFNDGSSIATYLLNGNANDLGGTYNGTATNVTYEEGKFGQAAKFNGSSSYINNFNFPNTTNLSISLWVKLDVIPSTTNFLYGQSNSGGQDVSLGVSLALTSNGLRIFHNGSNIKDFTFTFTTGVWYHIVHRVEGTIASIYVNNTLIGTHNFSSNRLPFNNTTFAFGKWGAYVYHFNGSIDQVRIFNRALTAQEVNTLYTETKVSANAQLNINQGTFIYPKGLGERGYIKSSDVFTGTVDVSAQTDGWKYVAKDENNNFSFYTDKPTIGKKSSTLYLKDGKLYKQVDDTPIAPISFLSNKVRIASGVAVELAPSDISKTVTESLEAGSYFGKNAIVAYATIDMTATPPTILDSYNIASVVRSSNGVGKIVLVNPVDKNDITAICGSNSVAGTVTSTSKSEINFATGATNYTKTTIIVIGGKN